MERLDSSDAGRWLTDMLREAGAAGPSWDLVLMPGAPPTLRRLGGLTALADEPIAPEMLARLAGVILSGLDETRKRAWAMGFVQATLSLPGVGRYRMTALRQRGTPMLAFRHVPPGIPGLEELGLADALDGVADLPDGLVILGGPAGSGRSTTFAALLAEIARRRRALAVTVEDPVERLIPHGLGLVAQREVGTDTPSIADGVREALAAGASVIGIGRADGPAEAVAALLAASSGRLVVAVVTARGAGEAVELLARMASEGGRSDGAGDLSRALRAALAQELVPLRSGGRVPVLDVLLPTPAVLRAVGSGRFDALRALMDAGWAHGMRTMAQDLEHLVARGDVAAEDAERIRGAGRGSGA